MKLSNNRYRVRATTGLEEVFADSKEEARAKAVKAGHQVKHVSKVQGLLTVASRRPAGYRSELIGRICGIALILAPAFAQAQVPDIYTNHGFPEPTNQPYPTGADVKPTPSKPVIEGCIAYANTSPDPKQNRCLDWEDDYGPDSDAETIVPGEAMDFEEGDVLVPEEDQVLVPLSEYINEADPFQQTWKAHWAALKQDRDGWQVRAIQAEAAWQHSHDALNSYAEAVMQAFIAAGIQ